MVSNLQYYKYVLIFKKTVPQMDLTGPQMDFSLICWTGIGLPTIIQPSSPVRNLLISPIFVAIALSLVYILHGGREWNTEIICHSFVQRWLFRDWLITLKGWIEWSPILLSCPILRRIDQRWKLSNCHYTWTRNASISKIKFMVFLSFAN